MKYGFRSSSSSSSSGKPFSNNFIYGMTTTTLFYLITPINAKDQNSVIPNLWWILLTIFGILFVVFVVGIISIYCYLRKSRKTNEMRRNIIQNTPPVNQRNTCIYTVTTNETTGGGVRTSMNEVNDLPPKFDYVNEFVKRESQNSQNEPPSYSIWMSQQLRNQAF